MSDQISDTPEPVLSMVGRKGDCPLCGAKSHDYGPLFYELVGDDARIRCVDCKGLPDIKVEKPDAYLLGILRLRPGGLFKP